MQPTRRINKQSAWNPIRLSAGICSDGAQGILNGYALALAALLLIGGTEAAGLLRCQRTRAQRGN